MASQIQNLTQFMHTLIRPKKTTWWSKYNLKTSRNVLKSFQTNCSCSEEHSRYLESHETTENDKTNKLWTLAKIVTILANIQILTHLLSKSSIWPIFTHEKRDELWSKWSVKMLQNVTKFFQTNCPGPEKHFGYLWYHLTTNKDETSRFWSLAKIVTILAKTKAFLVWFLV